MAAIAQLQTFEPTPRAAPTPTQLLALARSRTVDDRQQLLLGVAALCDASPPDETCSPVLSDIFLTLAQQAESDIRRVLAENLAAAAWAPPALVNILALDEIEIARPIIASSPLLKDEMLLRILIEASVEHQIEVARRPGLSAPVADAIIDLGEPATMTALAFNRNADVTEAAMARLVDHSRRIAALRAPLTRHPRLTADLAGQLYAWVGAALRQAIGERYRIDEAALGLAVESAVGKVVAANTPAAATTAEDDSERLLIQKLQSAGQLRSGFLVRALREQRMGLFEHALAALGGYSAAQVRSAVMRPSADALLLACRSVGVDRAVFAPMLSDVRKLTGGWPGDGPNMHWTAMSLSPADAAAEFRALVGG